MGNDRVIMCRLHPLVGRFRPIGGAFEVLKRSLYSFIVSVKDIYFYIGRLKGKKRFSMFRQN